MIKMIISGGQTGADRIGLEAAKAKGVPTGGMAPRNYYTEVGSDLTLKDFGLTQSPINGYKHRTMFNIHQSDGTVLFGDMTSPGSAQTIEGCVDNLKPHICNPTFWELAKWIEDNKIEILNVAGNRGSKLDTTKQESIRSCITGALSLLGF